MSFMPLYIFGAAPQHSYWPPSLAQLRLPIYTSTPPLPNIELSRFTWTPSLVITSLLASKYLHTSTAKTGTEDIHLITFTPQIWNLELKTSAWQPSLVQLHLRNNTCIAPVPTLNCTQPLDHMHLRSFTCQQTQGHLQWETWSWKPSLDKIHLTIFALEPAPSFSSCQKTHNFGMRLPAAYSPWQPHMEDVHLQTFPWHSWLWFIYADCTHSQKDPLATTRLGVRRAWSPHVPGNKQNPATHTHTHPHTHTHAHTRTHTHPRTHAHTHTYTHRRARHTMSAEGCAPNKICISPKVWTFNARKLRTMSAQQNPMMMMVMMMMMIRWLWFRCRWKEGTPFRGAF